MANFARLRDPGFWILGSVVLPEEFEAFDAMRPKLPNFEDGSAHAPSGAPVLIGGEGIEVTGPTLLSGNSVLSALISAVLAATGTLTVVNNSTLIVSGGAIGGMIRVDGHATVPGLIKLNGTGAELRVESGSVIQVKAGGALDVKGGATWYTGASLTVQTGVTWVLNAGSVINSSGEIFFSSSTWPKLSPARPFEVHSLEIGSLTYSGTAPADPDSWLQQSDDNSDPMIKTRPATTSGRYTIILLRNLPDGGDLAEVVVTTRGDTGTLGLTLPTYRIIKWLGKGARVDVSGLVTDVHAADASDWTTDILSTTITPSAPETIDATYTYALLINHVYFGGGASMKLYDVETTGTFAELRRTS